VRQAIAEAFAAIPDEGYPTLRDAAQATDMMLRRAAMFGLRRINATWALVSLYRASIEDDQWYVRSAAEQAFHEMRFGEKVSGVRGYPKVDSLPWLMQWVSELEPNTLKEDQNAEEILLMALERGDPETQLLSVTSMGQLGLIDHVGTLYTALRHRQAAIRDAAYRSLADLQAQLGYPLPSPV